MVPLLLASPRGPDTAIRIAPGQRHAEKCEMRKTLSGGFWGHPVFKVLYIGEIVKHKGIAKSKVLQGKKKAKVLHIYWLP